MKKTRCAFCLVGENKELLNYVATLVGEFKATKLITGNVTKSNVDQIFDCNKSIICTDTNIQNLAKTVVLIGVNNSSQMYNISIHNPDNKANFISILNNFRKLLKTVILISEITVLMQLKKVRLRIPKTAYFVDILQDILIIISLQFMSLQILLLWEILVILCLVVFS